MNLMVRERKEEARERESETEVKFSEKRKSDVTGFVGVKKLSQLHLLVYIIDIKFSLWISNTQGID
jgi:hypothetical protein